jgi:uncharacterized membrane protein
MPIGMHKHTASSTAARQHFIFYHLLSTLSQKNILHLNSLKPTIMRIIKTILKIIVALVIILLVAALFMSKDYTVEKSITINKPKTEVFNYIKSLKNQDNFSKWAKMDPTMKKSSKGVDETVGFTTMWEGNSDVGKGEQEIKKITEGQRMDFELRFEKPYKDVAQAYMTTDSTGANQTLVKWGINGHMNYPMNIMGLVMNKMLGGDFEVGLANLKALQEK